MKLLGVSFGGLLLRHYIVLRHLRTSKKGCEPRGLRPFFILMASARVLLNPPFLVTLDVTLQHLNKSGVISWPIVRSLTDRYSNQTSQAARQGVQPYRWRWPSAQNQTVGLHNVVVQRKTVWKNSLQRLTRAGRNEAEVRLRPRAGTERRCVLRPTQRLRRPQRSPPARAGTPRAMPHL